MSINKNCMKMQYFIYSENANNTARMIILDEQAAYHLISRTALGGFPIGGKEKDYLLQLIKRFSRIYFTEILGFCIMGNHFHILVNMLPESEFSDDEILKCYRRI